MTKFQAGSIHTSQVMDCQIHAIGRAIRLVFADLVTFTAQALFNTTEHWCGLSLCLGK